MDRKEQDTAREEGEALGSKVLEDGGKYRKDHSDMQGNTYVAISQTVKPYPREESGGLPAWN